APASSIVRPNHPRLPTNLDPGYRVVEAATLTRQDDVRNVDRTTQYPRPVGNRLHRPWPRRLRGSPLVAEPAPDFGKTPSLSTIRHHRCGARLRRCTSLIPPTLGRRSSSSMRIMFSWRIKVDYPSRL